MTGKRQRNCLHDVVLADVIAVVVFQLTEDDGGKNGEPAEHHESLVHAVDHLRGVGVKPIRDEECRYQRGHCNTEADRHLLNGAGDGACHAGVDFSDVGVYERVHTRVLQRGKESEAEGLKHDEPDRRARSDSGEQYKDDANDHRVVDQYPAIAKERENEWHGHFQAHCCEGLRHNQEAGLDRRVAESYLVEQGKEKGHSAHA